MYVRECGQITEQFSEAFDSFSPIKKKRHAFDSLWESASENENIIVSRVVLVPQLYAQLTHVTSCGWWRGDGGSPLHQPQLTTWASCAQNCVTRIFHCIQSKGTEFGSCLQIYLPKRRIQHVIILMIIVSLKFHQPIQYISQLISQIFIQYFINDK